MIDDIKVHPLTENRFCQCSGCGKVFSGLGAFDKHRLDGKCVHPKLRGLVLKEYKKGYAWSTGKEFVSWEGCSNRNPLVSGVR